jgi:PAS domain S-box-containing protein
MADSAEGGGTERDLNWDDQMSTSKSTVVLAVANDRTLASLRNWFDTEGHDVRVVDPGTVPADGDLFVVDQGALRAAAPALDDLKGASETFVPCLLVVSGAHEDAVATSTDPILDVVDDVLETPLRTPELRRRVESLLRARAASTQLREQRAHHERLVDLLPAGLFVLDDDHQVTYANAAAADHLRTTPSELVGVEFADLVHPDDRDAIFAHVDAGRDDQALQARLLPTGCDMDTEGGLDEDDNGPLLVETSVADVGVDDATQVLVQDVTERERRIERLRLFERAIAEAGIGITITDANAEDDPLVFANDGFCELTGYDRDEVVGRNCRFLQGEHTDPANVTVIREALDAEEPVSVTLRNYRKDGTPFWNHLEITPVEDDTGAVTHFLGFQRDVTERRERMRLFEHLHDATKRLQRAQTREAVAQSAVESVREILDLSFAECWFPREDGTALDPVAVVGKDEGVSIQSGTREWDTYVDRTGVVEVPITNHDIEAETGLVFTLGEHGLLGAADPDRQYTQALEDAGRAFADHVIVSLDRAERETELAETTREFENTLERINDGFMAIDRSYDVTYVNRQAERLLPYEATELEGENLWELFPEEVDGTFWQEYHAALDAQEPRTFEAHYEDLDVWFEVTAYPSEDGLTLYFRDVTAERERKQELERYETIVQTAGDPIYTLDQDGRFTSVNDSFEELTGYDSEEVIGEPADLVIPEDGIRTAESAIAELLATDEDGQRTVELTVETRDGDRRTCEVAIALMPGDEFQGTVGVVRDLTELKGNRQRLAVLDRVLRHNLRNNMNVVAGRASTLADHEDDTVVAVAREVERAATDVLTMAEKARTFQQALGDRANEYYDSDLRDVVADAVQAIECEHANADVTFELADDPLVVQSTDAVTLAVRELIENAVVHNPSDEPRVRVTAEQHGDDAFVVVADDGPEIPAEETNALTGGVETPLDHASGLGLWLVQWTATSFGGDLAFETSDDGNVVTLRLPLIERTE